MQPDYLYLLHNYYRTMLIKVTGWWPFFFQAAKLAGWLPADDNMYPKTSHVGFGLVLGEDGKRFRTRSTEVVRLVDLLDEAKNRSKSVLIDRGMAINVVCFLPIKKKKFALLLLWHRIIPYNSIDLQPLKVRLQTWLSKSLSIQQRQLVMGLLSKFI